VVELCSALVYFATFSHIVDNFFVEDVHFSHLFVDLGQVLNILCSILNHRRCQRPLLPKLFIILHELINLFFFLVSFAKVVFKEVVQADVDVSVVVLL